MNKESQIRSTDNMALDSEPKEKIAVVGYNGAGKSTLVKLLLRLYDVNTGMILIDGQNIKQYDVDQYRKSVGTVFQDFTIFPVSVAENIKMDLVQDNEEEKVSKTLSLCGMRERVFAMSGQINTIVSKELSDDGAAFSGGEYQKLAIARVFYKKQGMIILDEPSSALDPISEYEINQTMLNASVDNTVIFISHRLSTTRFADRIIFGENGKIVEQGSHSDLMQLNGKYAEMWNKQAQPYRGYFTKKEVENNYG